MGRTAGVVGVLTVLTVGVAAVVYTLTQPDRLGWFWRAWDHYTNLAFLYDTAHAGNLAYQDLFYPRGLHWLVALTTVGGDSSPLAVATTVALLELVLIAGCMALTASLAVRTVRLLGRSPGDLAIGVVTVMAAAALLQTFMLTGAVRYGFLTSIAAVYIVVWLLHELACPSTTPWRRVIASAAALIAISHVWQVLAVPVLIVLLAVAARAVRPSVSTPRSRLQVVAALVVAAVLTIAPLMAGIGATSEEAVPGGAPSLPWIAVAVTVAATAVTAVLLVRAGSRTLAGAWVTTVGVLVVLAALLVHRQHLDAVSLLDSEYTLGYYARKLLWFAMVVGLPAALALGTVAVLAERARTASPDAGMRGVALVSSRIALVCAAVVVGAATAIGLPVDPSRSTLIGDPRLAALPDPTFARSPAHEDDYLLSLLMASDKGQPEPTFPWTSAKACQAARSRADVVVVVPTSADGASFRVDCPGATVLPLG